MVHSIYLRKRTTDRQFSLLKSRMESFLQKNKNSFKNFRSNSRSRIQNDKLHWTELTEKLNNLGPPYRTRQQWKKVWCDVKRADKRRNVNSKPKVAQHVEKDMLKKDKKIGEREVDENFSETSSSSKFKIHIKPERTDNVPVPYIEKEPNYNNKNSESDMDGNISETATSSKPEIYIKSERNDNDNENSQSMHTKYSNDYDNDYSYPDEDSVEESYRDDKETFMPDESSSISHSYVNKSRTGKAVDQAAFMKKFPSPPPLQPSNSVILDQTIYSLQNQIEHQTKYLENLSQMSTTMASLMERQVSAIEKQTEAMNRQAFATERHTSVMNNFIDMIRNKFLKNNSHRDRAPSENSTNDSL